MKRANPYTKRRHPAEAEADAQRIAWLEAQANQPGGLLLHDGSETGRTGLGLRPGVLVRNLRQAIDCAMATEPTDQQLAEWTALYVMGWTSCIVLGAAWWQTPDGQAQWAKTKWNPAENLAEATLVAQAGEVALIPIHDVWCATKRHVFRADNEPDPYLTEEPTMMRAACIAALKIAGRL